MDIDPAVQEVKKKAELNAVLGLIAGVHISIN